MRLGRNLLALVGFSSLVAVAACAGGGGGGGSSGGGQYGGSVALSVFDVGSSKVSAGTALFVASAGTFSFSLPALDVCPTATPTPTTSPTPGPTPIALDAGPTVALTGSGQTLTMTNASNYYSKSRTGLLPVGVAYDMAISGGTDIPATNVAGALEMPQMISVPATTTIPASGDASVTWTPGAGDYAMLQFYSGPTPLVTCLVHDDGSFTVPADAAALLPSGTGSLYVFSYKFRNHDVAGRTVLFEGLTGSIGAWSK